jgi:hypothetical protein
MDSIIIERLKTDADGNEITKNYNVSYELGTLVVSEISEEKDSNGENKLIPIMIQPWKCLPDGSRDNFANSQDAFDWFNEFKDQVI